jgi:hypothetical protein
VLFICLSISTQVFAASTAQKEAEKLLNTVGMDKMFNQSIQQMLNIQMKQNPQLVPYKDVMLKFFNKYMSYSSLKNDIIKIYTDTFTQNELKDINNFYSTQTGKKTIKLMPMLMMKGNQLGVQKVQSHIQELQQMIDEETKRLNSKKK